MKQLALKTMQLSAVATILIFTASSCNKQPSYPAEDLAANKTNSPAKLTGPTDITTANPFNKRVGAPVDGRTGTRWIAKYKQVHGESQSYILSNATLQAIISQPDCVGISLTYALDANNSKQHIIPIGVDINGKIMKCATVSTMQGSIPWATAQQWIADDKGAINSHFTGSNTIDRLNENPCKTIQVDYAIDDKNQQQLLLSNPCELNAVKKYEDQNYPCPTWCPSN